MKKKTAKKKKGPPLKHILLGIFFLLSIFTILLGYTSKKIVFANEKYNDSWIYLANVLKIPDPNLQKISQGPKLITVQRNDVVIKLLTTSISLDEIIKESGIAITDNDLVFLNNDYLIDGSIIRIIVTQKIVLEEYTDIPYETETVETTKYSKGTEYVSQKGVLGVMRQRVLLYYEDDILIKKEILDEFVEKEPQKEIIEIGTSWYTLEGIELRGYNCPYWYSVVDREPYSEEEKRWLKFIMYCESGCNAESNKSNYKGLFQWSPYWWRKQFPENIFDGHAQIKNTVSKYRAGESTRSNQWPACHTKYLRTYESN